MAVYNNLTKDSAIASVEFTPVADGNFAFFYVDPAKKDEVKAWLTSSAIGQEIVGETQMDGKTILITQGEKEKKELEHALEARGEKLKLFHRDKKFEPWKWRGNMSNAGQVLQLSSAFLQSKVDGPTAIFAISNLTANVINVMFGAEKSKDVHRLKFLKNSINQDLIPYKVGDDPLPSVDEHLSDKRKDPEPPKSMRDKAHDFMKRNSVRIGEIGLRYFGAFALAFPIFKQIDAGGGKTVKSMGHWKTGFTQLAKGSFKGAFDTLKNTENKANLYVGVTYLIGKTVALFSKVPDPYDPKPHSWLDTVREKYLFRASSVIEGGAAIGLAANRFGSGRIKFKGPKYPKFLRNGPIDKDGVPGFHRDFLGGTGGILFASGFAIRLMAPFGVKEMDMNEVYAHATEVLAKTPPEKMLQLMAETSVTVKEQLKDKPVTYGEIFTKMMTDLYRYHHIATPAPGAATDTLVANQPAAAEAMPEEKPAIAPARRPSERVMTPAANHAEALAKTDKAQQSLGIGV